MTTRVLAECFDEHDRLIYRERLELSPENPSFSVGRSLAADLVLNDEHVAELHATLTLGDDGRFKARDEGSVNGLLVGGRRHHGDDELVLGDNSITIGQTTIRLRSSLDTLEPERQDGRLASGGRGLTLATVALAAAASLSVVYGNWVLAPDDLLQDAATDLAGLATVVVFWVAGWALLTRILKRSWQWRMHIAIVLATTLAAVAFSAAVDLGLFALGRAHSQGRFLETWSVVAQIAALLYLHLRTATRLSTRSLLVLVVGLPVVIGGAAFWLSERSTARNVNVVSAYRTLFPPSLRIRQAQPLDEFLSEAGALESEAQVRRDRLPPTDNE